MNIDRYRMYRLMYIQLSFGCDHRDPLGKIRVNMGSAEGLAVPVALVTPIVLQLNNTNII
jgi:hypothetical protein